MESIEKAEQARCNALKRADGEALRQMLADDFLYLHASGRTEDKTAYIASITGGTFRLKDFSHRDVTVKTEGETSVMSGIIAVTREEGGNSKVTDFSFVGVWVGEKWPRLLFWKHSKV